MNQAATRVLKLLGCTEVAHVNSSCGAEQEYFLVVLRWYGESFS